MAAIDAARGHEPPSTRDLILDAAEYRFAERGYAGVSMREIAADAGLKNQASLYDHFRNKRALYEAVLTRGLEPIVALLTEKGRNKAAADSSAGREIATVDEILDRLLDYLAEHPNLPRLIQRAGLDDHRYLPRVMPQFLYPVYTQGLSTLAGADSPWHTSDLPHVAIGMYHLIFGYFANLALLATVLQADPRSPAAVARQRRFVKAAVAQLLGVSTRVQREPVNSKGIPQAR